MLTACLLPLYSSSGRIETVPSLQLLDFEQGENDGRDIILRLSDGVVFIDCLLVGNYMIDGECITSAGRGRGEEFRRMDIVQLIDYFHKIDEAKITKLKIIVRKLGTVRGGQGRAKIGRPQEIAMYVSINHIESEVNHQIPSRSNAHTHSQIAPNVSTSRIEFQNQKQVKIYDDGELSYLPKQSLEEILQQQSPVLPSHAQTVIKHDENEPLTVKLIMQGVDGFFIGRLLRMKSVLKINKEGDMSSSMPMLCLGFLDLEGEMLHINLLGKTALKEERILKVGHCYYIKGIMLVQVKASNGSYIRLKQPDYRLHQITNEDVTKRLPTEYYHWEHESEHIEHENVDVIGIIEDIEEKTFYGKGDDQKKEKKEVIRVVIRNAFKTVRVSFWADQIRFLEALGLKLKEPIILTDAKKKKSIFLDYAYESAIIKLEKRQDLLSKFQNIIFASQNVVQPINIRQLLQIYQSSQGSSQIFHLRASLIRIHDNDRFLIKLCDLCKKKINLSSLKCFQCGGNVLSYKYSTILSFSDYSNCIIVYLFEPLAQKFFGMNANQMRAMQERDAMEFDSYLENLLYKQYGLGLQIKGQRIVMRSAQQIDVKGMRQWIKSNLHQIQKGKNVCKIQDSNDFIQE